MPCGLSDDLADLNLRLDVGEVGDVAQELLAVLAHALLEIRERVAVDVPDRHVRRRRAGSAARHAFVDLGAHQPEARQAVAHELHVAIDVAVVVELLACRRRVEHGAADHAPPLIATTWPLAWTTPPAPVPVRVRLAGVNRL